MEEEFIGVIKQWAGWRCPTNFMLCEGQLVSIKNHEALFSIIGTTYGGDGVNNFKLPDLRPTQTVNVYKLHNPTVFRARETGDPGTIGYVADSTVVFDRTISSPPSSDWGNNPKFIICVNGIYPSFD